jgi:pheromone a factor receptor
MWPILISVASFIYAGTFHSTYPRRDLIPPIPGLTIRAFLETRRQFSQVLSNSASGLNMSRYFRLMALAATEMMFSLPLSLFFLTSSLQNASLKPWISWDDTHLDWGFIGFVPRAFFDATPGVRTQIDLSRWVTPAGAFVFFAYFGLAGEASEEYRKIFWRMVKPLGLKPSTPKPQTSNW